MFERHWFTRSTVVAPAIAGAIFVATTTSVSGQGGGPRFRAHPSTQEPSRLVTLSTLQRWEKELSNWGRWGTGDQRGLLNLITPEKTKQATTLVKKGTTVTLQINPFKKSGSDTGGFGENVHRMARIDPTTGEIRGALDIIQLSIHDGLNSHLDALCHYQGPIGRRPGEPAVSYNGFPFTLTAAGCRESAADRMGPGYVTRGILVDMPLLKNVEWLEPSTPIYVEDLEAWEEFVGITIGAGDALLVRNGAVGETGGRGALGLRPGGRRSSCVRAAMAARARRVHTRQRRRERRPAFRGPGNQPPYSPDHAGEHGAADRRQRVSRRRGQRSCAVEAVGVHAHPPHLPNRFVVQMYAS